MDKKVFILSIFEERAWLSLQELEFLGQLFGALPNEIIIKGKWSMKDDQEIVEQQRKELFSSVPTARLYDDLVHPGFTRDDLGDDYERYY